MTGAEVTPLTRELRAEPRQVVGLEPISIEEMGLEYPSLSAVPDHPAEIDWGSSHLPEEAPRAARQQRAARHVGSMAHKTGEHKETPESRGLDVDERCLTEVDNLNRHRLPDSSHSAWAYGEVMKNQVTAVKEAAIPNAVSRTYQDFIPTGERDWRGRPRGTYRWLGKTAIEVAESGFSFHKHEAAHARVAVEVEEARHNDETLRAGYAKVFISPRMSEADASSKVAEDEHLGADDSLRISWMDGNETGDIRGKQLESILVKDIPLSAWVSMLRDPNNIWDKSIAIENPDSALSVMKAHRQLEIPLDQLPEGVVSLVEAVLPYIEDPVARESVARQLLLFRGDQEKIDEQATNIAARWMQFEVSLADSLYIGRVTADIEHFINQLQCEWSDADIALFDSHRTADGDMRMTRKLAARLEQAKQNLLWTAAAVITGNTEVLKQLDQETAQEIYDNEIRVQAMTAAGYDQRDITRVEAQNNKTIAQQNVSVGSGCPGKNTASFRGEGEGAADAEGESSKRENWKKSKGPCRIKSCPNSEKIVDIGPCRVCMVRCQKIYDKGGDPTELPEDVIEPPHSKAKATLAA